MNYEEIIRKIEQNEQFSFFRWGDGEFACMRGDVGQNCDKHPYSGGLAASLHISYIDSKNQPNAYFGIQNHARRTMGDYVEKWTSEKHANELSDADVFVKASQNDQLHKLWNALKMRRVIFVAPERYNKFNKFNFLHLTIPDVKCWLSYGEIHAALEYNVKPGDVVLYSASMMSNVLMDDFISYDITQIDVGSVFEPYIGNANRKYHKEILERLNA